MMNNILFSENLYSLSKTLDIAYIPIKVPMNNNMDPTAI